MAFQLSERVRNIIEGQKPEENVLKQTLEFLRQVLEPDSGRYDMLYRYEHTLRVTAIGQKIARKEALPEVPLMIACMLHDVGYPECSNMEELKCHPAISAEIAEQYLQKIQYEQSMTESICRAISIHDVVENLPEWATPLELSVRDADDIDRFDEMRMCILGYHDIGERSAEEIIEICHKRLELAGGSRNRVCGTNTAKKMWLEQVKLHENFYRGLLEQMQLTGETERFIRG